MPLLAVSEEAGNDIKIYDGRGESQEPVETISDIHHSPVILMSYNNTYDCVISADSNGMIEYWRPTGTHEKPPNVFQYKSSTNLFEFKKAKSLPSSLTISPTGTHFATFSFPDRKVRIFDFATGKLHRTYDESLSTLTDMQTAGTALQKLDDVEFGRRLAIERDLDNPTQRNKPTIIFDESGHFILYGSLPGIKVLNTHTNRVVKVYGATEPFRALNLALYQGAPQRKGVVTAQMAASANPLLQEAEERDPMLVATGAGKVRFYIFTNEEEISKAERDVQNEKPRHLGTGAGKAVEARAAEMGSAAVLHTTMGDIHLRLFPEAAPKTVENFVGLARRGYYNGTIFHRVIRKFMIQVSVGRCVCTSLFVDSPCTPFLILLLFAIRLPNTISYCPFPALLLSLLPSRPLSSVAHFKVFADGLTGWRPSWRWYWRHQYMGPRVRGRVLNIET